MQHQIFYEPQPIADQIKVYCKCGWREFVSLMEYDSKADLWNQINKLANEHLENVREATYLDLY